jgi:hypothetical protein
VLHDQGIILSTLYIDALFKYGNERGVSTTDTRPALSSKRMSGNKICSDSNAILRRKIGSDICSVSVDWEVDSAN